MDHWRQIQSTNIRTKETLIDFLKLSEEQSKYIIDSPFPFNLPIRLASKIQKSTLNDPILKQFVPLSDENKPGDTATKDPLAEATFRQAPKLLHKYNSRLLLLPTSACAMHCRYCFRRHFPYETKQTNLDKEINYIEENKAITEVILSGGDPLSLSNKNLKALLLKLNNISHIQKIRFHTRFILGVPERIDKLLIDMLGKLDKQVIFVIHTNHPLEIDQEVLFQVNKIQKEGIPVLTQAVLLAGVNDDFETLQKLFTIQTNNGIIPYYLHDLDDVVGASHFKVEKSLAFDLMKKLRENLPGYAVPRFVCEQPHKKSKTLLQ